MVLTNPVHSLALSSNLKSQAVSSFISLRSPYLLSLAFLLLFVMVLYFSPLNQNRVLNLKLSSPALAHHNSTQYVSPTPTPTPAPAPARAPAGTQMQQNYKPLPNSSRHIVKQNKSNAQRIEEDLTRIRAAVRKVILTKNYVSDREEIQIPRGSVNRNPYAFH